MQSTPDGTVRIGDHALPVRVASGLLERTRGHMFRRQPPDYALAFRFAGVAERPLHMVAVPFPLDGVWVQDGAVTHVERLRPWLGHASARADLVLELPAGAVDVTAHDPVRLSAGVPA